MKRALPSTRRRRWPRRSFPAWTCRCEGPFRSPGGSWIPSPSWSRSTRSRSVSAFTSTTSTPRGSGQALADVVESCVNYVGVELNTASAALLRHVAGISERVAQAIVAHRSALRPLYEPRSAPRRARVGPKTFEQCAGLLEDSGGGGTLGRTAVHPESYPRRRERSCG